MSTSHTLQEAPREPRFHTLKETMNTLGSCFAGTLIPPETEYYQRGLIVAPPRHRRKAFKSLGKELRFAKTIGNTQPLHSIKQPRYSSIPNENARGFRSSSARKHSRRERKSVPPSSRRSDRLRNKSSSQEMHAPIDVDLAITMDTFDYSFAFSSRNGNGIPDQYECKATTKGDGGSSLLTSLPSVASIPRQSQPFEHLSSFITSEEEKLPCVLKPFSLGPSRGLVEASAGSNADVAPFKFHPAEFP